MASVCWRGCVSWHGQTFGLKQAFSVGNPTGWETATQLVGKRAFGFFSTSRVSTPQAGFDPTGFVTTNDQLFWIPA